MTLTLVIVTALWRLTPIEQGLYFSFQSFGALLQLSEFGLSYAVLQTASHLVATDRRSAIAALAARAMRRNAVNMTIAALVVGALGAALFAMRSTPAGTTVEWFGPWLTFVVTVIATQYVAPLIAAREGSGAVREVWRFRFAQELVTGLVFVGALAAKLGLWSLACYWGARFVTSMLWLKIAPATYRDNAPTEFSAREWSEEVWPFQWKIGLSYLSGFFVFFSFSPIVLSEQGAVNAGRIGLSVGLMNMLLAVTTVWPQSQAARYGHLLGTGDVAGLHRHFLRVSIRSTIACIVGVIALSSGLAVWSALGLPFAERYAEPASSAILLATATVHHVVICFAVLLRAERREPFLLVSVVGGVVSALGIWLSARYGSMLTVVVTNLVLTLMGLPIAYGLYKRRRRVWTQT